MASAPALPVKRERDQRLDLFRGVTMLIIFVAHLPQNSWNAWIPARFGFSSGAELFVFCSGVASASAFGSVFVRRGLFLGTARIAYRIWQIYWVQVGLVLALIALAAGLDRAFGLDVLAQQFQPLLADPATALFGIATLTWQPDYLDILPMYLVILALVPAMMLAHRLNGVLPLVLAVALYAAVWSIGIELPGNPWNGAGWFLNPFAWQFVFFLGFFMSMGWLPVPRLGERRLMLAAGLFLLASVPLSFWAILEHWPDAKTARDLLLPANEKTDLHILRVLHFLALAYVVLSVVAPWRDRLDRGAGHLLILIGRQSLACFLAGIILARIFGSIAEMAGRGAFVVALLNLAGFLLILGTAVVVGWFKSSPWSRAKREPEAGRSEVADCAPPPSTRVREAS